MNKPIGRPPKARDKALSPGISVRMTESERQEIRSAAKRSGLTQSDWTRKALLYVGRNDIRIT